MADLDNPAFLWPTPPTAAAKAESRRWIWSAMDPPERRERLRELAVWVAWLRTTFELHNQIPVCWYRHSPVVEHLSALYVGWARTYAGDQGAGRELAEAEWINTLHALTPRLQLAACATGTHEPAPPPPVPGEDEAFELYLATSDATTSAPHHPAAIEAASTVGHLDPPMHP